MSFKKDLTKLCMMALAILGSVIMMTYVTYAVFTDTVVTNNHLEAGTLDAGLIRTKMFGKKIDANTGLLVSFTDDEDVDLTVTSNEAFSLTDICPTMKVAGEFQVSNNGSIAFTYEVSIINVVVKGWDSDTNAFVDVSAENYAKYLKQIQIKIGSKSFTLDTYDALTVDGARLNAVTSLAVNKNANDNFTVFVEVLNDVNFLDNDGNKTFNNNDLQGMVIDFDIQVVATQVVS